MDWWQTLVVSIATLATTKIIDHCVSVGKERREFTKSRRNMKLEKVDKLVDEISVFYEVTMNWKPYEQNENHYNQLLVDDDIIIGKFNRYPKLIANARKVIHHFKIIAVDERDKTNAHDLTVLKSELAALYSDFLKASELELDNTV